MPGVNIVEIKPGIAACLTANETANAGLVVGRRDVVLIDALNTPAMGRRLAAAISDHIERPVRLVVNTHHHYDHVFGNQAFDAPVIAHSLLPDQLRQAVARDLSPIALAAWLSQHPEDRWLADELDVIYPSILFDDRLVLDAPPLRLVIQHVGGHTPESCIVDLPEAGVLFAGDLVFEGRVPFLRQAAIEDTINALRDIEYLGQRIIIPGHGAPCDTTYVARVRDYIDTLYHEVRVLVARGWDKGRILDSDELPAWWTDDRPELVRQNIARVYDEVSGSPGGI